MGIARKRAGDRSRGGSSRWRVLLLETNRDHAELISEALEESLPGIEVLLPEGDGGSEVEGADLVIAGEEISPEWIRQLCRGDRRLPLLRISERGPEGEPASQRDDAAPVRLSKKEGLPFLIRLSQAVEDALGGHGHPESGEDEPADGPSLGRRALPDALADVLIRELTRVAAPLAPWVEQAGEGSGPDLDAALAAPGLRRRLACLRALLERLEAIRGGGAASPRSVMTILDGWMRLRRPVWDTGAGHPVPVVIAPRKSACRVSVVPSLLGPVLDRLVERGIEQCAGGGKVEIETGTASFSGGKERFRGLPPGRYERLSVIVSPTRGGAARPLPRLLVETGIAAAKASGGFFYGDSRGGGEFLFPGESFDAPARQPDDPDLSVLIVESDPALSEEASRALEGAGCRVVRASNRRHALALYQAGCRYRLVIAGAGALEDRDDSLFSGSRLFDPAPLVIAGYSPADSKARLRGLLEQGVLGLIPWPCSEKDLIAAARVVLGS